MQGFKKPVVQSFKKACDINLWDKIQKRHIHSCLFYFSTKLEASVCSGIGTKLEKISPIKFTAFPFLRFGHLTLDCTSYPNNRTNEKEFDKKCEQLRNHLQRLKPALIDSTMEVTARTYDVEYSSDPNCFDQDYLLYYLRNEILPICDTWRYEFSIESNSDWDTFKHIVGEILQIPQVARCSDVRFNFRESVLQWPASDTRLPVEAISNWLNRPQVDAQKINAQSKERMRSLSIFSENHESNVEKEMCEHLKEVCFIKLTSFDMLSIDMLFAICCLF